MLYLLYDIIFLEPSIFFQYAMWSCDCDMWQFDITLTLTLVPKIENKGEENKNGEEKEK